MAAKQNKLTMTNETRKTSCTFQYLAKQTVAILPLASIYSVIGATKIENQATFLPSRKAEKMETTQKSAGGRNNFGPDYAHYFMRNSQNNNAEVNTILLVLTW